MLALNTTAFKQKTPGRMAGGFLFKCLVVSYFHMERTPHYHRR
jgi:hypothetical protein